MKDCTKTKITANNQKERKKEIYSETLITHLMTIVTENSNHGL